MIKTVILGDEFDENFRENLVQTMCDMGVKAIEADWSAVGSQELESVKLEFGGRIVEIEAETYVGLSITGEEADVTDISEKVWLRR